MTKKQNIYAEFHWTCVRISQCTGETNRLVSSLLCYNILSVAVQGLSLLMMACADGNQALAEYLATHKPDQLDLVVSTAILFL